MSLSHIKQIALLAAVWGAVLGPTPASRAAGMDPPHAAVGGQPKAGAAGGSRLIVYNGHASLGSNAVAGARSARPAGQFGRADKLKQRRPQ